MRRLALAVLLPVMAQSANYTAKNVQVDGVDAVELVDAAHQTRVVVVPAMGNIAAKMEVKGQNIFWMPAATLSEWKGKPALGGNPFLAPWANRLDEDAFYANGVKYALDAGLGNLRRDQFKHPIHGLLAFSDLWRVSKLAGGDASASVSSKLEFWRYPALMAQFPFAHDLLMTYTLKDGVLEVVTTIENHAKDPLPVAVGYHPYFKVHDAPRDDWRVHLAAKDHLTLSGELIPTGATTPQNLPDPVSLAGRQLDDVFGGLVRGADGRAVFSVQGKSQKISVIYGPKYTVAVVYAPPGRDFICFEPMSAITNGFNLAHRGVYKELQSVPAGGRWTESFWIAPSGF